MSLSWASPPEGTPVGDGLLAPLAERPTGLDELGDAVRRHAAAGRALYPVGGGTALDYGGTPERPGVAVVTTGLGRVIDYPAADMTITIEAGMTLAALQATLSAENQRLPLDAPTPDRATLGGIFASNFSGPRRFGAGRPRDLILGIRFVNSAGEAIKGGGRVVKNVAGYDLPKLLTGSLGTLGIIAELTLKVRPRPEAAALVLAPFDDPRALDAAVAALNTSGTRPMAIEALNRPAARRVAALDVPWLLVVGFEDNAASVAWQVERARQEVDRPGLDVRQGPDSAPLWSALADFPAVEPGPLGLVASVRPSAAIALAASLPADDWAVQVHAGSGIVRALALVDRGPEVMASEVARLRAEAGPAGGSVVLSHCAPGRKERLGVWGDPRPDWPLMRGVKRALDPPGVMNPGRLAGII